MLKEKLSTVKLIALTGAVIGVALIVSAPRATVNITGAIMAIAAAMINATMVVTIKKTVVKIPPLISSAAMLTWGALVMSSIGLALRIPVISGTSTKGFMIIQALAVIPTVFSVSLLNKGLSLAEASHSSIIMTSEPLLNAVLAAVLLNEKLTLRQSLGGAVIICSLLLLTIGDHRREKLKNQLEEPQDVLT